MLWNYGKYLIALAIVLALATGSYSVWKAITNPTKVITGVAKDALKDVKKDIPKKVKDLLK